MCLSVRASVCPRPKIGHHVSVCSYHTPPKAHNHILRPKRSKPTITYSAQNDPAITYIIAHYQPTITYTAHNEPTITYSAHIDPTLSVTDENLCVRTKIENLVCLCVCVSVCVCVCVTDEKYKNRPKCPTVFVSIEFLRKNPTQSPIRSRYKPTQTHKPKLTMANKSTYQSRVRMIWT